MRVAIGALALILAAGPVSAQDANARAEKEARSWLKPCKESDKSIQQMCLLHQQNFIHQYVFAKSGDTSAMGSTSFSFSTPIIGPLVKMSWIGMPLNLVQACAWQVARMESTRGDARSERLVASIRCDVLSPNERRAALERAVFLLAELREAPAKEPNDEWLPKVAGLAPLPTIDPKCLDNTAEPLTAGPPKPLVPPPGCPRR